MLLIMKSSLQCSNFKYDADNHYSFPAEESQGEDNCELDDDNDDDKLFRKLCSEMNDVDVK